MTSFQRSSRVELDKIAEWLKEKTGDRWWEKGRKFKAPEGKELGFGWIEIFDLDNWHCIYCGRDLVESTDTLAESTEEHIVPQSLFATSAAANIEGNVGACCAGCNSLKGPAVPPIDDKAWESRKAFISGAKTFISEQRASREKTFGPHVLRVKKTRAWPTPSDRQKDYS